MNLTEYFQWEREVPPGECDFMRRLTMGGLLRLVQEISTGHCDALGVDAQRYRDTQTAFLLAKLSAEVYLDIPAGETLTLATQPALPTRAVYHRYTTLSLANGQKAAAVDARWVLVSTQSHRILRAQPPELGLPFTAVQVPEQSILIPKGEGALEETGSEGALYSRCDYNGHLNNTRYADIVCDHLPVERFRQGPLAKLVVNYHRELPLGHRMRIFRQEAGEGFYLTGREGEQACFEAYAKF